MPAILFAGAYALILLAVAAAKEHLGESGLYTVAALSGLTDMDAITLSVTELVSDGKLAPAAGWRAILTASLSNIVFKTGIAAFLGGSGLFLRVASVFAVAVAAGVAAHRPLARLTARLQLDLHPRAALAELHGDLLRLGAIRTSTS